MPPEARGLPRNVGWGFLKVTEDFPAVLVNPLGE